MYHYKIIPFKETQSYFEDFKLQAHLDELVVTPNPWYRTKIGDDDTWGVNLILSTNLQKDPYFVFYNFLYHPLLEGSLFTDRGYTSGYDQVKLIRETELEY